MNNRNDQNGEMENLPSSGSRLNSTASVPLTGQGTASRGEATATMTITETNDSSRQNYEILHLTLQPRPSVRWDEDVLDNEGLGRKSSKRCCIFHKQRDFGESSTDSSDDENGQHSDSSSSSGGPRGNGKPIARKKAGDVKPKKVPDYQRFHA